VITDRDFDANFSAHRDNEPIVLEAIMRSPHFIMLLHVPDPERVKHYRALGAEVVEVAKLSDFPRVATELSRALFPDSAVS